MSYTVKQLAHLSGTSVRALHHYDAIGLLKPASVEKNGYRLYGEHELLRLQQILFFRELDFSLDDIRRILERRTFDMRATLREHKRLLAVKKKRLEQLMETIEKTIKKLNKDILMEDKELYGGFSKEEAERYAEEARERWGHTDAYKESQIRVKRMGKAGLARVMKENGDLLLEIVATMPLGVKSEQTQRLIAKHYNHLRNFY